MRKLPQIKRDNHGVPHIHGNSLQDMMRGLGYCHASDRGLQMLLMRIFGQGRASEYLEATPEMLEADLFFRRMNWFLSTTEELATIPDSTRILIEAYCDGINECWKRRIPWELRLLGYQIGRAHV